MDTQAIITILLSAAITVVGLSLLHMHRRLRILLTYLSRRIDLHDDQLSIARDLLIEHHQRHGFRDSPDQYIWDDTDTLPPMYNYK